MENQDIQTTNESNIVYMNYYEGNKEKILARRKEYVKNNYEKVLEQNKKYYNNKISDNIIKEKKLLRFQRYKYFLFNY